MAKIHPSSIVHPDAQLADSVEVGPFCIIGPTVKIGAGTVLRSHVVVEGRTTIGENNVVFAGASVGCQPQDKKYAGEDTALVVGDRNVIRENCTLSIGTVQDKGLTVVGSGNLFMANVHIAHDCQVGSQTILAGQSAVHQFVRVGAHAMVGGMSALLRDLPPYVICSGNPAGPHGLNSVGLRRHGFTDNMIRGLHQAYRYLYRDGLTVNEALEKMESIKDDFPESAEVVGHFIEFIAASDRGLAR